ncbi:zf-HC2 domain-containing protein [Micromonospora sp. NPDC018662]|uniref:zf-HC2 domain-containing protein n=1 Tax=Micromonospora sp. NPDC018662 TaxID=3364238 RepID=UPI00379C1C4D
MSWHVHPELIDEYQRGGLDTPRVMAVEAHLTGCPPCRSTVTVDVRWLDDNFQAVLDVVQAPRRSLAERALCRLGVPEHRALVLAATPALRRSWLAATAVVLAFAVSAAYLGREGQPTLLWFLVAAPVLPVLAVATAYGAVVDRLHEITSTTPTAGPGLVLWRALAVVGVSMSMGVVAAMLLPDRGWYAVAWLLPAFLLCLGSLALATVMPLPLAAGLLGGGWLTTVTVLTNVLATPGVPVDAAVRRQLFGPAAQAAYLVAGLVAALILIMRRRRLEPGGSR